MTVCEHSVHPCTVERHEGNKAVQIANAVADMRRMSNVDYAGLDNPRGGACSSGYPRSRWR